jgi:predicted HTH transcriptional regulator
VIGVDLGKRTLEEIASRIAQNTDPRVYPEIEVRKIGDKNVVGGYQSVEISPYLRRELLTRELEGAI